MHKFLCEIMFSFLLCIHLGMELLGHMETPFQILRNCHTVSESSCMILHSHQQGVRVPISPHPFQQLLLCVFFDYSHPSGVKLDFIVVLICISPVTDDVGHIYKVLIGHLFIFLGEMFIQSPLHLKLCYSNSMYF